MDQSLLLSTVIRMGNAGVATIGDHRNRHITKIGYPQDWLPEFEVISSMINVQMVLVIEVGQKAAEADR